MVKCSTRFTMRHVERSDRAAADVLYTARLQRMPRVIGHGRHCHDRGEMRAGCGKKRHHASAKIRPACEEHGEGAARFGPSSPLAKGS